MDNNKKIISLIQTDSSSYINVLIRGLVSSYSRQNKNTIIIDLRSSKSDLFWTVYNTEKIKYVDDMLNVISNINVQMLKTYLNVKNEILCIKDSDSNLLAEHNFNYLLQCLTSIYENIIVVIQDRLLQFENNILDFSDVILLPFIKEPVSFENFRKIYMGMLTSKVKDISILPIMIVSDFDFDFQDEEFYTIFKNIIKFKFDSKIQNEVVNPGFLFKDKSNEFVKTLDLLVEKLNNCKSLSLQSDNYYEEKKMYINLKDKLHKDLVEKMKEYLDVSDQLKLREIIKVQIETLLKLYNVELQISIKQKLVKELSDDIVGLGVLEDLLEDPKISEIMVNGNQNIYIEKNGKLEQANIAFQDKNKLKIVIDRIASSVGRHIDEASPIVDARLKDGSRVNAIIAPVALNGPILTIRKFSKHKLSADDIISYGSASKEIMAFLKKEVSNKKNILISGGTGTGKTTLLNVVSSFIDKDERIITIEDSAELQLQQEHVIRLETRPKSIEGTSEISIRQLVINALRMRPDRIIVGECRSGETLDMLQAMNTGHDGSMTTVHSNSCQDAISRLLVMSLMAGVDLPEKSIISMIASAINIIVQIKRFADGTRKISEIYIVKKSDTKQYELIPVFLYDIEANVYKSLNEGYLQ
jgi:pilus assembly protein CpaF